ncbi:hypothetical protein F5Y10DRAFT_244264 [Nemania abortiva]|nr:hypothetical protein F5Y10DRAFT_244264 [Nemania abortiva]
MHSVISFRPFKKIRNFRAGRTRTDASQKKTDTRFADFIELLIKTAKDRKKDKATQKRFRDAIEANFEIPEKRFPVVIQADSAFPTVDELVAKLHLESAPEVLTTKTAILRIRDTDTEATAVGEKTVVCDISYKQLTFIEEKWVTNDIVVWFRGKKRFATVASSEKEAEVGEEETTQT